MSVDADTEEPRCPTCGRELVAEERRCVDCGQLFEITQGERTWFLSRGLWLPHRCRDCRRAKKEAQVAAKGREA